MYTGNVWGIALFVAGFLAALIGFQLLLGAVFRRSSDAALGALRRRTAVSALLGAGALVVLVVAAVVLGKLGGPGKFLAALLLAFASFPVALGLGVVSRFVGERMPSPADAGRPWRATLRGGVTCALAFAAPLVGWFLVLPASIVVGLGAVTLSSLWPARELGVPALPAEAEAKA